MRVEIWLKLTSKPIIIEQVTSTYQKGDLFCVYTQHNQRVQKWPVGDIWRVVEEYSDTDRRNL